MRTRSSGAPSGASQNSYVALVEKNHGSPSVGSASSNAAQSGIRADQHGPSSPVRRAGLPVHRVKSLTASPDGALLRSPGTCGRHYRCSNGSPDEPEPRGSSGSLLRALLCPVRWRIRSGPIAEDRIKPLGFVSVVRRRKRRTERERVWSRSVLLQVSETLLCLGHGRDLASRNPPQDEDGPLQRLKPLFSCPQRFDVATLVHEMLQRFHRLPYRHVDRHQVVARVRPDGRGVAIFRLQAPDESRAPVRNRVDRIELDAEAFHDVALDRTAKSPDVCLCKMVTQHRVALHVKWPASPESTFCAGDEHCRKGPVVADSWNR